MTPTISLHTDLSQRDRSLFCSSCWSVWFCRELKSRCGLAVFANLAYTSLINLLNCCFCTCRNQKHLTQLTVVFGRHIGHVELPCYLCISGMESWNTHEHLIPLLVMPVLFVKRITVLEHIAKAMRLYLLAGDTQFYLLSSPRCRIAYRLTYTSETKEAKLTSLAERNGEFKFNLTPHLLYYFFAICLFCSLQVKLNQRLQQTTLCCTSAPNTYK